MSFVHRLFGWRKYHRTRVRGHKTPDFSVALHKGLATRAKNRKKRKKKRRSK